MVILIVTNARGGLWMLLARKRRFSFFLVLIPLILLYVPACSSGDEKLVFNGTEVLYDSQLVNKEQAKKLGTYLDDTGFTDGSPKTVELAKSGPIWQFKLIVQDTMINDPGYQEVAAVFAAQMSRDIFNGEPVEIHFCDDTMTTKKVVQAQELLSQLVVIDQTEIFFDGLNVTSEDAEQLGLFLKDVGFIDGVPKSIQIDREGSVWQFKMIVSDVYIDNLEYTEIYKEFAKQISEDFYNSAPVEIHLCNDYFETMQVVRLD